MGFGCLLAIIAAISPRLALFLLWLFGNDRLHNVFKDSGVLGFLGFIFLPFTTLVYIFAYNPIEKGFNSFGGIMLVFALFVDLSSYTGGIIKSSKSKAS